jgi:hypothetical protein
MPSPANEKTTAKRHSIGNDLAKPKKRKTEIEAREAADAMTILKGIRSLR